MNEKCSGYRFAYRDLAEALYYALGEDAFYTTLENYGAGREGMLRYLDYSMVEAREYGELFIPDTHRHGVSVWLKPLDAGREAAMKSAKRRFLFDHLGGEAEQKYQDIVRSMAALSASVVDDRYWYLSIIGVAPAQQGRGIGPGLVSAVLAHTDRIGAPTYLETFTPRNHSFYERLGYRVADAFDEPVTAARYSVMTRIPRA